MWPRIFSGHRNPFWRLPFVQSPAMFLLVMMPHQLSDDRPQSGLCKCDPCAIGAGVLVCSQLGASMPLSSGPHFCDLLWLTHSGPASVSPDLRVHQEQHQNTMSEFGGAQECTFCKASLEVLREQVQTRALPRLARAPRWQTSVRLEGLESHLFYPVCSFSGQRD